MFEVFAYPAGKTNPLSGLHYSVLKLKQQSAMGMAFYDKFKINKINRIKAVSDSKHF
jgi:hypothetical protein